MLDCCIQARDVQLSQRKKSNREAEAVSGVAEGAVPKGNTAWERVISVCNFNAEGLRWAGRLTVGHGGGSSCCQW